MAKLLVQLYRQARYNKGWDYDYTTLDHIIDSEACVIHVPG
jgi:hypothetical protein